MTLPDHGGATTITDTPETVELFITAAQGYPAMERLVLNARERLDISLHVFQPGNACRSDEAVRRGIATWADLLADALERGVTIRLLLNDFDAVGGVDMHSKVWTGMQTLLERLTGLRPDLLSRLHIQVAHPGGESGVLLRAAVWVSVRQRAFKALADFKADHRRVPGLAELGGPARIRYWPPKRLFTQTLHQKFMIADTSYAVVGGLDVDERFYDDPQHQREGHQTWHDVAVGVTGPAVLDLARHFARSWNLVRKHGVSHAPHFLSKKESDSFGRCFQVDPAAPPPPAGSSGRIRGRATVALQSRNPLAFGPVNQIAELEQSYCELIRGARSHLYIETQFLRSSVIRDALVAAAGANPDLHVILLLPGAPDDVAFKGKRSPVHRYGEWLQTRALERIQHAFGPRFGAFCLTNGRTQQEKVERDALYGKAMVYVHAKVMLADDRIGVISSANLNGRSLRWDYEAGTLIDWPERIKSFRQRLWQVHLGPDAENEGPDLDPARALRTWTASATRRMRQNSGATGCGVVPFPHAPARRFARWHLLLPENTV